MFGFTIQALLNGGFAWPGGYTLARDFEGFTDHGLQAMYGLFLVPVLAAFFLGLDNDDPVLADTLVALF